MVLYIVTVLVCETIHICHLRKNNSKVKIKKRQSAYRELLKMKQKMQRFRTNLNLHQQRYEQLRGRILGCLTFIPTITYIHQSVTITIFIFFSSETT